MPCVCFRMSRWRGSLGLGCSFPFTLGPAARLAPPSFPLLCFITSALLSPALGFCFSSLDVISRWRRTSLADRARQSVEMGQTRVRGASIFASSKSDTLNCTDLHLGEDGTAGRLGRSGPGVVFSIEHQGSRSQSSTGFLRCGPVGAE